MTKTSAELTRRKEGENQQGKRTAVCFNCDNEWTSRKGGQAKPSRCPECHSRQCGWKDEIDPEDLHMEDILNAEEPQEIILTPKDINTQEPESDEFDIDEPDEEMILESGINDDEAKEEDTPEQVTTDSEEEEVSEETETGTLTETPSETPKIPLIIVAFGGIVLCGLLLLNLKASTQVQTKTPTRTELAMANIEGNPKGRQMRVMSHLNPYTR